MAQMIFIFNKKLGLAAEPTYVRLKNPRKPRTKVDIYKEIDSNGLIIIEGDAGIGKSKFLRRLASYYCDPGIYNVDHVIPVVATFKEFLGT
jgi:hypothetical protein